MSSFIKATVKSKRYKKDLRRSVSLSLFEVTIYFAQPPQAPGDSTGHWCTWWRVWLHTLRYMYTFIVVSSE